MASLLTAFALLDIEKAWHEDDHPRDAQGRWAGSGHIKGWWHPGSNKPALFNPNDTHYSNPPVSGSSKMPSAVKALKQGYVRFGSFPYRTLGNEPGQYHYINYDYTVTHAKKNALKTLHFLNPQKNDQIAIEGGHQAAGTFKTSAGARQYILGMGTK